MREDPQILERNLAALLQRAYSPARPNAAFRARVKETVLQSVVPSTSLRAIPGGRRGSRGAWLAAAAALIAAVAMGWWLGRSEGALRSMSAAELLSHGRVAVLAEPAGAWRAASDSELSSGIAFAGTYLEVHTPAPFGASVNVAQGVRLVLDPSSRATLTATTGDGAVQVILNAGGARFDVEPRRVTLIVGGRYSVSAGAVRVADSGATPASAPLEGAREPVSSAPVASKPAEPRDLVIRGVVRDAEDGTPLTSFRVVAIRRNAAEPWNEGAPIVRTFSGPDGTFELNALKAGSYSMFVDAPEFSVGKVAAVDVAPSTATAPLQFDLRRGARARGFVLEAGTNRPIDGAIVWSEGDAPPALLPMHPESIPGLIATATTAAPDGSFDLMHVAPGYVKLRASAPGFAPAWSSPFDLVDRDARESIVFKLTRGGSVKGFVARPDGTAWPKAAVVATLRDDGMHNEHMAYAFAMTDASGRYRIDHLPSGLYTIVLVGDGATPGQLQPGLPSIRQTTVAMNEASTVDFVNGARLHGDVTFADGKKAAGRGVSVLRKGLSPEQRGSDFKATQVDANGAYEITGLQPGTYEVYQSLGAGVVVVYFGDIEVTSQPEVRFDMRLDDTDIAGTVTTAETGAPVPRTVVVVERLDDENPSGRFVGYQMAGPDGRFAMKHFRHGVYRVSAYATSGAFGFESTEPVTLDAEHPRAAIELKLEPGALVRARVVDEAGAPVEGAMVELVGVGSRVVRLDQFPRTDARGLYTARGVKVAPWTVRATKDGYTAALVPVAPKPNETTEVTLTLAKPER